jgi:hypothetical protein
VPLDTMKAMIPYITAGGSVYRAQIIGHFDKGNPVARLEVILDATQHPTRVVFWKDMSNAAIGFRFPGEISNSSNSSSNSNTSTSNSTNTTPSTNSSTAGQH